MEESKLVRRTLRRYILALNRERRIRFIGKQIALSADDVRRCGWFEGKREFFTKHLRRCGGKTLPKLRLRNTDNLNVFLNADFWAEKLPKLLSLTPPPHLSSRLSSAADMLSSKLGHSADDDWNPYTVKFKQRQGFAEFMTAVRNVFPNAVVVGKAGVNSCQTGTVAGCFDRQQQIKSWKCRLSRRFPAVIQEIDCKMPSRP